MSSVVSTHAIWINGELIPAQEARVSVTNRGFLLGDGVFETLRTYRGEPFAVTRHWNRLNMGCAKLCIPAPAIGVLQTGVKRMMESNRLEEARIRVTVTPGDSSAPDSTVVITTDPLREWPASEHVVTVAWTRNENAPLTGIKSLSYGDNVVAMSYARSREAGEALFGNTRGNLCEGAASNVFVVFSDRLVTPPLSSGCLPGVTRELVLEAGRSAGIRILEEDIPMSSLSQATEVFLTSTTREVHPVSRVDDKQFSPVPGALTREIADVFRELTRVSQDP